ncbi:MAG: four helix bundle protein [Gemmatimonadota bacterium]
MHDHTRLEVWRRANDFSAAVHLAARKATWRDAPGLKPQLLRAVASIPANIAEGAAHSSNQQFAHFTTISIGSINEAETHLRLVRALGLFAAEVIESLLDELTQLRRMLFALRKHLQG